MKKFLKPAFFCAGILLILALLVSSVIFFIPRDNTAFSFECFRLRLAVSDFLNDVAKERLDDAFERVCCVSENGEPLPDSDACREVWTARVSALRDANTYLKDFSDLTVRKTDGNFVVSVTLSVIREGYNDPFYADGCTLTVVYADGWRILSLSDYEPSLQTDLEKALSGTFSSAELAGSEA